MAIDQRGDHWHGDTFADLVTYVHVYKAAGYAVTDVGEAVCADCGERSFRLVADDDEGCVQRTCTACGAEAFIADSGEFAGDADLWACECPCGGDTFGVAVGFARGSDNEVRWVSVGLRCLTDGRLGVYADWKIDYTPTHDLSP